MGLQANSLLEKLFLNHLDCLRCMYFIGVTNDCVKSIVLNIDTGCNFVFGGQELGGNICNRFYMIKH